MKISVSTFVRNGARSSARRATCLMAAVGTLVAATSCGPVQSTLTPSGGPNAYNFPTPAAGGNPFTNWNGVTPAILDAISGVYSGSIFRNDPIAGYQTQPFTMTVTKLTEPVQNTTAIYLFASFVSNGPLGNLGFQERLAYGYSNGSQITAVSNRMLFPDLSPSEVYVMLSIRLTNTGQVHAPLSKIQYKVCEFYGYAGCGTDPTDFGFANNGAFTKN